jgi:conflict system pore-forming effector with SLATT domain
MRPHRQSLERMVIEVSNADDIENNNIWWTSKVRMHAEKRFHRYSVASHLLLAYYALVIVLTSIFGQVLVHRVPNFLELNIAFSVVLFASSLIVYGFKFSETAQNHRDCYLRIQRLLSQGLGNKELQEKYHEILAGYPNHSSQDYDDFIIERTFVHRDELTNSSGPKRYNLRILFRKFCRLAAFWGTVGALLLAPVYLLVPFMRGT